MVSQKRRRFEIRRRQNKHQKRSVLLSHRDIVYKNVKKTYFKVNDFLRKQKPLSAQEVAELESELRRVKVIFDAFQLRAFNREHLFSKPENMSIRHSTKSYVKFIVAELGELREKGFLPDARLENILLGSVKKENK